MAEMIERTTAAMGHKHHRNECAQALYIEMTLRKVRQYSPELSTVDQKFMADVLLDATCIGAQLAMAAHCKEDSSQKITIQQYETAKIHDGQKVVTPFEHFANWQNQR
jgi:hypothetical protein